MGNWFSAFTVINVYREENQEENTITTWVHIAYGSLQVEDKENIKILLGRKDIDLCFLYSIGNDVRSCEKEEYIPRCATGLLKVQNGEVFSKENGE